MRNWLYLAIAAFLSFGFESCSKDEDYSSDLEELKKLEEETASKLDDLSKAQEELKQKQEALNKQQEELTKLQNDLKQLQEDLAKKEAGTQDTVIIGQEELMAEISSLQKQLSDKLDDLSAAQAEIRRLQGLLDEQQAGTQDSISANKEALLAEINKMETELAAKIEDLAKVKDQIQKLQDELTKKDDPGQGGGSATDTTGTAGGQKFTKYDDPEWTAVAATGDYAYSMTVVFELPSVLKDSATSNDVIAAFVGDECRAVAKANDGVFFLNVIGTGAEESPVVFRYWNAGNHYLYEAINSVPFSSDYIYGVVDEPKAFVCKQK